MKKVMLALMCVWAPFSPLLAQTGSVKVKLRIVLVDKDLNQKPVPFLTVILRSAAGASEPVEMKTGLDGTSEANVAPGRYSISTPKPVELGGKRFRWEQEITFAGSEQTIELTNDNAKSEDIAEARNSAGATQPSGAVSGDLTALFDRLKNSVVSVRAERGLGSGFLADPMGLIVTNNHVVESSDYLAVQFDQKRKVPARVVASDANKDVAVLWVNLSAFPEAAVAPLMPLDSASPIAVGERVFTIGNPLGREKVLTTGVISKVEKDSITSDISISPGNSGGPLFTLAGQVAGITTAGVGRLASIVPVEEARRVVEDARKKIAGASPPAGELLPVEPADYFPADVLRALLQQEKMDTKPYFFDVGEFRVALITPPLAYFASHEHDMAAARESAKRSGGDPSQVKPPSEALEDAQGYRPVVIVRVQPKLGVGWTHLKFKNGFQKMRLLCGGKEMPPIDPGRGEFDLRDRGRTVDTTFQGHYVYLPDAISPACSGVVLEIFSEKDPKTPVTKPVDAATVERVWADLEPYRKAHPPN